MSSRRGVRSNTRVFAYVAALVLVGAMHVGCTSCLVTPKPTPVERLDEALRKAGTLTSQPPAPPLVCPSFASSGTSTMPLQKDGHRVILSWRASAPADSKHAAAIGYCIYRGLTKKDPSPVLLNNAPFPGTSCMDDSVVNDTKYYYVVRAISTKGVTSIVSNEAPATIPKQSNPSPPARVVPLCREPGRLQ
jgi:hypothetical protein